MVSWARVWQKDDELNKLRFGRVKSDDLDGEKALHLTPVRGKIKSGNVAKLKYQVPDVGKKAHNFTYFQKHLFVSKVKTRYIRHFEIFTLLK